jgi:ubiquinone/menaquinone biosynthesis C-methylase UbiE
MNNQPSNFKAYDIDACITEIYDQTETQTEDVRLLRELIGKDKPLKILEPFCGNGRILIPLAQDGHRTVGMDKSTTMLESARRKIKDLPLVIQKNITLKQADVLIEEWPKGFDLVILGGNCLYELATPEEQETCIHKAQQSLKPGGYLYLDNDHMEGDLDPKWRKFGINEIQFPTGKCSDGTMVKGTTETIWYDAKERLVRYRRTAEIITPDGKTSKKEWIEQCHPPSTGEMKTWLNKYSFVIDNLWGDRQGSPYTDESERAIFWARLSVK